MGRWMTKWASLMGILALGLGLAVACTQGPTNASPQEFYRGKTVTWIVSSDAGTSSDLLARAIAPYLAEETGATVKVDNMGTDEGSNWVYNEAKKDGLTFIHKSTGALTANDILQAPGTEYEVEKYLYIADVDEGIRIMAVSPDLANKTLEELRKMKGLKAGGTSAKGSIAISGAVVSEVLGLDAKVITGYSGSGKVALATKQRELDFYVISDTSAKMAEDDGMVVSFLSPNDQRSEALPNVPTMYELGVKVPKDLEGALEFVLASGQALALPPGTPADRVEYLRKIFDKLETNKELQSTLSKLKGAQASFMSGKDLQDKIVKMKADKELAGKLNTIFDKRKAVQ
ncbi:MAG: hypothetical protein HYY30_05890 [Chloroflexi bacterium]|nr:hypothetical protein [Chloroflexota bacterium]